ncbi:MAG: YkgJ family cysteine cluster protein [Heliobacteriaceae bacterium]|nr:YkgJ family cysteine cluster protein [Heliobacteriaceae bacterium]
MVKFALREFPNGWGYDVSAVAAQANIADYIEGLERFFAGTKWTALRREGAVLTGWAGCAGCPACCRERIPLTIGDLVRLSQTLPNANLPAAVDRYAQINVQGPVVDVVLKRDQAGWCCLFDHQTGRCRQHGVRPLVCRTFFCSPVSHRAEKLRLRLVNQGEDELVRWLLLSGKIPSGPGTKVRLTDYPSTAWACPAADPGGSLPAELEKRLSLVPFTKGLVLVSKDW